jgi:hypothetical protein
MIIRDLGFRMFDFGFILFLLLKSIQEFWNFAF